MLIEHLNHAKQRGLSEIRKLFWIFIYLWVLVVYVNDLSWRKNVWESGFCLGSSRTFGLRSI